MESSCSVANIGNYLVMVQYYRKLRSVWRRTNPPAGCNTRRTMARSPTRADSHNAKIEHCPSTSAKSAILCALEPKSTLVTAKANMLLYRRSPTSEDGFLISKSFRGGDNLS